MNWDESYENAKGAHHLNLLEMINLQSKLRWKCQLGRIEQIWDGLEKLLNWDKNWKKAELINLQCKFCWYEMGSFSFKYVQEILYF